MKRLGVILVALAGILGGAGQARADFLVYDNGPLGGASAYPIQPPIAVSDSFTVANPTVLTSAQVGLWVMGTGTPETVEWSIGTMAFGANVSSGTSPLVNVSIVGVGSYAFEEDTISLNGTLSPGTTYWLTLQNETDTGHGGLSVEWGLSANYTTSSSIAYAGSTQVQVFSESFQLYGEAGPSTAAAPEPASAALLGIGIGALAAFRWRQRRHRAANPTA